ncbi:MAG: hypothetical protein CMA72_07295 [Euryarchaeota archaeon]|nr:hypothetical protein [Euryarchaeota archaeon]
MNATTHHITSQYDGAVVSLAYEVLFDARRSCDSIEEAVRRLEASFDGTQPDTLIREVTELAQLLFG